MVIAFGLLGLLSIVCWLVMNDKPAKRLKPPRIDCIQTGARDHWEVSKGRTTHTKEST